MGDFLLDDRLKYLNFLASQSVVKLVKFLVKNITIIAFLIFLSGCGGVQCLTPNFLLEETIADKIPTKPDNLNDANKNDPKIYWVKSDLEIGHEGKTIVVTPSSEISLCSGSSGNFLLDSKDLGLWKDYKLGFSVMDGESLKFKLSNSVTGEITEEICDRKNPNIYVEDRQDCKRYYVGSIYGSKYDNSSTPSSNRYYSQGGKETWLNGRLHIVSKSGKTEEEQKRDLKFLEDSGDTLMCDPNWPEFHKVLNVLDTNVLNEKCGRVCGVTMYDEQGGSYVSNRSGCARTEVTKFEDDGSVESYIQSLQGLAGEKVLDTYGDLNPGIRSNFKYGPFDISFSSIKLRLSDVDSKSTGGYNLMVEKDCSDKLKDSLYIYISKDEPNDMPGAIGQLVNFLQDDGAVNIPPVSERGRVYYGVKDNGDGYENNLGYFEIVATIPRKPTKIFSRIILSIKDTIMRILYGRDSGLEGNNNDYGPVSTIYHAIIDNKLPQMVVSMLILYVMVQSLFFLLGISRLSQFEVIIMVLKMSIIIQVISPNSWDFFYNNLFQIFIHMPLKLIDIMTSTVSRADNIKVGTDFAFLDTGLQRFTYSQTWLQILSLVFTGPVGWLTIYMIYWGALMLLMCILEAVIVYFISITVIALLMCIAPIFIVCLLFKRTKGVFDGWIKILIQTSMQPVFVFTAIAMLNQIMDGVIYSLFNYEICQECIIKLDLGKDIIFCLLNFFIPVGFSPISTFSDQLTQAETSETVMFVGLPIAIGNVIIFVILGNAMQRFVEVSGELCANIFNSFAHLSDAAHGVKESLFGIIGMDENSRRYRAHGKYQSELQGGGGSGGAPPSLPLAKQTPNLPMVNNPTPRNNNPGTL